jgi:predicted TIM-barrel fold metal-dependent hydrolase
VASADRADLASRQRQVGYRALYEKNDGWEVYVQRLISADSHMDLGWLPQDLFTSRMDRSWGERTPHVEQTPDGPQWVSGSIVLTGIGGVGAAGRRYEPGRSKRADRMADTGLYAGGHSRPGDPQQRLAEQDRDGVFAEVLYGLHAMAPRLGDAALASAIARAFNDYLFEFCAVAPERLIGLACLPIESGEAAAAELVRCARLGMRGAVIDIKNAPAAIHDASWDPLWAAASECGLPVSFHMAGKRGGSSPLTAPGAQGSDGGAVRRDGCLAMALLQYVGAADYFAIILGGALDRYPSLQIVLAESGIGWIPHMLERLEYVVDNDYRDIHLDLRPSEYWRRQMYATFSKDQTGIELIDRLGEDRIMFASDYPHPDGIFPDSLTYFTEQTRTIAAEARDKVAWRNAADVYGIKAPASV